jgi:hypothetical protein
LELAIRRVKLKFAVRSLIVVIVDVLVQYPLDLALVRAQASLVAMCGRAADEEIRAARGELLLVAPT